MSDPKPARKTVYFAPRTLLQLDDAENLSARIAAIVDRYGALIRRERINDVFSDAEIDAVREAVRVGGIGGWPFVFGSLASAVEDTLASRASGKQKIDGQALMDKLWGLTSVAEIALLERIERGE